VLSVKGSRELQAVVLALKIAAPKLRPEMYARTRQKILPDWTTGIQEKINAKPYSKLNSALLKGQRVSIGTQGVTVLAAQSSRPIRSGSTLIPSNREEYGWPAAEFGAKSRVANIRGRRGATQYQYSRKIMTGFLPNNRKGKFVFRQAEEIVTRSVAMWVQTVVQVMREAVEKGETNG
jgi:hypothetical protein